jgi:hypothetical protein
MRLTIAKYVLNVLTSLLILIAGIYITFKVWFGAPIQHLLVWFAIGVPVLL